MNEEADDTCPACNRPGRPPSPPAASAVFRCSSCGESLRWMRSTDLDPQEGDTIETWKATRLRDAP